MPYNNQTQSELVLSTMQEFFLIWFGDIKFHYTYKFVAVVVISRTYKHYDREYLRKTTGLE